MSETIRSSVHMILSPKPPPKIKKPIHLFSYYFRDVAGISKYCNMYHTFEIMVIIRPTGGLIYWIVDKETHILLRLKSCYCYASPRRMLSHFGDGFPTACSTSFSLMRSPRMERLSLKHRLHVSPDWYHLWGKSCNLSSANGPLFIKTTGQSKITKYMRKYTSINQKEWDEWTELI